MAVQTSLEKLQYNNEKNVLIQGLPSSIEKHFSKISFSKNVTPLLRVKKVEFALLFAVSKKQLADILTEVMSAMHPDVNFWIAHPKPTAKIASDLCRDSHWPAIEVHRLEAVDIVELDTVWCATQFKLSGKSFQEKNSVPRHKLVVTEEAIAV